MNPLNSVGIIGVVKGLESAARRVEVDELGSCFAFRQSTTFLTARHCVPEDVSRGRLVMPGAPDPIPFATVEHHPHADLSVITIDPTTLGYTPYWEPFWNYVANWQVGEEFMAYGYPVDTVIAEDPGPTPRLFRGHYQRFWYHLAGRRFHYLAGELSVPAPAGLSGGPLFRPGALPMVTGMVTSNIDSTTYTDEVVERTREGKSDRTVMKRIVSYGVAAMLSELAAWLDDRISAHQVERPPAPKAIEPCRFRWGVVPNGWVIEVEPVRLDISGLGEVHYLAIYADTGEMMFTMPLVGRPVSGVNLMIGM